MTAVVRAAAKINLALVVGARRPDGLHPVASVMQRISLHDTVELEVGPPAVTGFADDTIVGRALADLAEAAGVEPRWRVRLAKEIPVAAGLGGGSADAAAALRLANETLPAPLEPARLHALAARLGADVPFFLASGPQLAEGAGERLRAVRLPRGWVVVLALAPDAVKVSTGEVYARFDALGGGPGFPERRERLLAAVAACRRARDLASFPLNDLAAASGAAPLVPRLLEAGAFRADVSGAGPTVYALFESRDAARSATLGLPPGTRSWVVDPVW